MAKGKVEDKHDGRYIELQPPCFYCKHLIDMGYQDDNERWTCKAFPEGIPFMIWSRNTEHDQVEIVQEGKYVYKSKK